MVEKLKKIWDHHYISGGLVHSFTHFFTVPAGVNVIWMVYDGTISGRPDNEACWNVIRRLGSVASYLGVHDAPYKCQPGSQEAGAWAGSKFVIGRFGVGLLVARESQIIPQLTPFFKGSHHTLEVWRPTHDEDGWRNTMTGLFEKYDIVPNWEEHEDAPDVVMLVRRLKPDKKPLMELVSSKEPPEQNMDAQLVFQGGSSSSIAFCLKMAVPRHLTTRNFKIWWKLWRRRRRRLLW
eukprot:1400952-Ditylum_brightwellii.AAC.1